MDTPGIRELQLSDCGQGISDTFSEIIQLGNQCRFHNCNHDREPGCAVLLAVSEGLITQRRLNSYQKLMSEQALNKATLTEKRSKDKALGKKIHNVKSHLRPRKKKY